MSGIIIGWMQSFEKVKSHVHDFFNDGVFDFYTNGSITKNKKFEQEIIDKCKNKIVDTILLLNGDRSTTLIASKIRDLDVDVYFIPHYIYDDIDNIRNLRDVSIKIDLSKPRLDYFEYHVCDHCNLNCKGCGHFSNIESEEHFADYDQYVRDLKDLKRLFNGIDVIRLMGGSHY